VSLRVRWITFCIAFVVGTGAVFVLDAPNRNDSPLLGASLAGFLVALMVLGVVAILQKTTGALGGWPPPVDERPKSARMIAYERSRQYTRTCRVCGEQWVLPAQWAKEADPGLYLPSAKMASWAKPEAGGRVMHLTEQRDRVLRNAMCPKCSSADYEQVPGNLIAEALRHQGR
jgi:hypothetical protein